MLEAEAVKKQKAGDEMRVKTFSLLRNLRFQCAIRLIYTTQIHKVSIKLITSSRKNLEIDYLIFQVFHEPILSYIPYISHIDIAKKISVYLNDFND